ncbi:Membrane protein [Streptomyces ambofaciens ATCC 23877]|uniref:Membrane protein n=1 Tax=Streptomyces ambofaciens (strain ATCC 23877 / 3486 / DSM 40053 / JCM 4204 / NBRC 12836 / NRRL B-2516) TaxID=278992 RepID=A0A0K2AYU4_STRA7|nr:hypothetical protein [Streptomyces ambofaciens]AKZ58128.1 Membrane protein [Streptomyces ambofaciens ATCC 23877]
MTASGSDSGAAPDEADERDGVPPVPEDVWRRFLQDDERAIRASAPREPSARERTPGWRPGPAPAGVGEPWHPEDPRTGPAWRELDTRARLRRTGRVIGTAAAVALALTAWSQLSAGPGTPGGGPADTIGRRPESPVPPTAASLAPAASGSAGPAVFQPVPSAVPRPSATAWTTG